MFFQLIFFALAVAVSAAPYLDDEPPIKFVCHLSQDPGKQICRRDGLTLSVYTSSALPIDVEIKKAELDALIKSWTPAPAPALAPAPAPAPALAAVPAVDRPKRQLGFGGGLAGASAQSAAGGFGGGYGGGYLPGGFGGGFPSGGFGGSNSFSSSQANAFGGGGSLGGYGR
ncbi:hypothetical protein LSTR_LSTR011269 [Laodelphax striatellus]|uniref:Uncharacterized protein n=1 Tax=Laodelphax striatellus TaxID=195883 RepID=A0A482WT89_LAOST|nr:hypothetical protein LSTR_LSTR011269 [Laodelphax striatellus]